jgi:PST family polysaccharide transporter
MTEQRASSPLKSVGEQTLSQQVPSPTGPPVELSDPAVTGESTVRPDKSGTAPKGGLARATSRGILVTLGGQWARTLIQTASTVVMARLLAPQDFGLIAMVTVVVGIADLLRDFGLSGAIVQAKAISKELWSSLIWLSFVLGLTCMLVVAVCAPLIAALYDEPRLTQLVLVLSPGLLINGICMPLQGRLQRELRFGTLAQIDVVSMLVGVAAALAAAAAGWGVWSLVLLTGGGAIYRLIALICTAWPGVGRPRVDPGIRPMVGTGAAIFGVQILNYAARNIDNVVVGRYAGAAVLGLYSRAYALLLLPLSQLNGPIARVALPVLSRLRDEHDRYRKYVRSALLVIGYLACPVFAISGGVAIPLCEVLLGPQWTEAGTIFTLLTIAGVAQAFGNVQGWLYISLGRARRQFFYYLVTRPVVIASFFLGFYLGGVNGLALLYGVVSVLLLWPGFSYAITGTAVTWSDILAPVARPLLLVPGAFLASWLVGRAGDVPAIVHLVLGGLAGTAAVLVFFALPSYRTDFRQIMSFVRTVKEPNK